MNLVFIIDTSFSMMQCAHSKLSQLDVGKLFVEQFIKMRQNYPEAKYDKHFLLTTNSQNELIILSSYEHDLSHFYFQLRNLVINHTTNSKTSILTAYSLINRYRIAFGYDNYLGGRDPLKIDNSMIILITDGTDPSFLPELEILLKIDKNYLRWDQQFYVILLNSISDILAQKLNGLIHRNFSKFNNFCQTFGGYCLALESIDKMQTFIENLLASIRHKLSVKFGVINISKIKTDQINYKHLNDFDSTNSIFDTLIDKQFIARLIIRLHTNHLLWRLGSNPQMQNSAFARLPMPENPLIPCKKENPNPNFWDLPDLAFSTFPEYYIDFSKNCGTKLVDMPGDYYEIEAGCEFYQMIVDYMSNFPYISKINFPVFHLHNNINNNPNEHHDFKSTSYNANYSYTFFGIIKFSKRSIDNAFVVEFIVFPYNMLEFNNLCDELIRNTNLLASKVPAEYPLDFIKRLEQFFEKMPNYYGPYIHNWMMAKKMHVLAQKNWKFFTNYICLKAANLPYEKFVENCRELIEERLELKKKNDKRYEENHQKHSMNISSCCDIRKVTLWTNTYFSYKKAKILQTQEEMKALDIKNLSKEDMLDELMFIRKKLFISSKKTIITSIRDDIEIPVRHMSDYQKYLNNIQNLRDPFADEFEKKVIKEALPFGNPFKFVVRQSNQNLSFSIADEDAYLSSSTQSNSQYGLQSSNIIHPDSAGIIGSYDAHEKKTKNHLYALEKIQEKKEGKKKNKIEKEIIPPKSIISSEKSTELGSSFDENLSTRSNKVSPTKILVDNKSKIIDYFSRKNMLISESGHTAKDIFLISQAESKSSLYFVNKTLKLDLRQFSLFIKHIHMKRCLDVEKEIKNKIEELLLDSLKMLPSKDSAQKLLSRIKDILIVNNMESKYSDLSQIIDVQKYILGK